MGSVENDDNSQDPIGAFSPHAVCSDSNARGNRARGFLRARGRKLWCSNQSGRRKGEGRASPRSVIHAIFMNKGKLYFIHFMVLFAGHQDEARADQIRLIKGVIRK